MKKITAFFMALFPFLVVGLLFATNLISRDIKDRPVQALEMKEETVKYQKTNDGSMEVEKSLNENVNVVPAAATDPTIYWTSEDEKIVSVGKETGKVTCNNYGSVKLNAVAKTNSQAKAACTVKVWDDRIHQIVVKNEQQAKFITPNSQFLLDVDTSPNEDIAKPGLTFAVTSGKGDLTVSQTGLITAGSAANGEYQITIKPSQEYKGQEAVTKVVTVNVSEQSVSAIGFDNEANAVISASSYNLFEHIVTSPIDKSQFAATDFTYLSSDKNLATVDENGVVHFTNQYVAGTPVTFTALLGVLAAQKTVVSSMDKTESVSFAKYAYTEEIDSFPSKIEDSTLAAKAYPVGTTGNVQLTSSDSKVIEIRDNVPYAIQPGKAVLTATAPSLLDVVKDSVEVTVLKKNNQELLESTSLDLKSEHYYPLRKNLKSIFETRKINWSEVGTSTNAVLDASAEIVYFTGAGSITVKAEDEISKKTQEVTIKCTSDTAKDIEVASGKTVTVAAGQKLAFKKSGSLIGLTDVPEQLVPCGTTGQYVAIQGSTNVDLEFTDGTTMSLVISEPLVSLKSADGKDWSNYTTNATDFILSNKIITYPATATYVDASSGAYTPEIKYSVKIDDESSATYSEYYEKLSFLKPYTVTINASCEGVTKTFKITSTCGQFGKFSMTDGQTNKQIEFDETVSIAPGATLSATIDNFYCEDQEVSEATLEVFSENTKAVSGNGNIVSITPRFNGKCIFDIKGIKPGTDIIKISNGQFTFVFNVKVTQEIMGAELYCLDSKITKGTTVNAYDKKASLIIDINPVSAKSEKLIVSWNGKETTTPSREIKLEDIKEEEWLTDNTLIIKNTNGNTLGTYTIKDCTSEKPTFKVTDVFGIETDANNNFYLYAKATYATMRLDIGGIASLDYYKNFASTAGERFGKYFVIPVDAPSREAYTKDVTISQTDGKTKNVKIVRDIVSRIEFPKHDNDDESDAKGLQRVNVFGNSTQLAGKSAVNKYWLPVNVYDYDNKLIEDKEHPEVKNNAIATLNTAKLRNSSGADIGSVEYSNETQCYEIVFDTNYLYTWQDMFDNKFVDAAKNQICSVSTAYGASHKLDTSYAQYSFVVVNGVNVYDQKGIEDASKTTDKSIVLQSSFGMTEDPTQPVKEDTPFELTSFNFNQVYGNGYSMNFHAITKAAGAGEKTVSVKHAFNTNFVGCWFDQFTGLDHKAVAFANNGATTIEEKDKETFAYCTFNSFYQPFTIWCASGVKTYTHIKNCLFFNTQEYCRNALSISDEGNTTTIEDCAFFNAAKIAIMCNKGAVLQLKGNIDVYNFHGSDMFDCMGWSEATKSLAWSLALKALEAANAIQGSDYGSLKPKTNAYLFTTLGGSVKFYDHTDASGNDVYITSEHGSEKAANYLKHATGLWGIIEVWVTTKPPLNPLATIHAPAYFDEFLDSGALNYDTMNILIYRITRW